jgi:hypothetical protein
MAPGDSEMAAWRQAAQVHYGSYRRQGRAPIRKTEIGVSPSPPLVWMQLLCTADGVFGDRRGKDRESAC